MFIKYAYKPSAQCCLRDVYFSIIFEERMKEIRSFFEAR